MSFYFGGRVCVADDDVLPLGVVHVQCSHGAVLANPQGPLNDVSITVQIITFWVSNLISVPSSTSQYEIMPSWVTVMTWLSEGKW